MNQSLKINLFNKTKNQILSKPFESAALQLLQEINIKGIVEVDITICSTDHIRRLNLKFRHRNLPTDVLSFPLIPMNKGKQINHRIKLAPDEQIHLGDIVICYPIAKKQAEIHNININQEITNLFIHGFQHLLGFHHS